MAVALSCSGHGRALLPHQITVADGGMQQDRLSSGIIMAHLSSCAAHRHAVPVSHSIGLVLEPDRQSAELYVVAAGIDEIQQVAGALQEPSVIVSPVRRGQHESEAHFDTLVALLAI